MRTVHAAIIQSVSCLCLTKLLFIGTILLLMVPNSIAQDIENIGSNVKNKLNNALEKPVQLSGGVNAQFTNYTAFGIEGNRAPYLWQVGLNLNVKLFDLIDLPFSATISSQQFDATLPAVPQPFNNFGVSPKYKAVTAHLGYRSINLSEFSLSGSQFLGAGLEVSPKNAFIKGKALWGRFAEPVLFNPNGTIATTPTFARFGWGAGVTLGKKATNQVGMHIFNAKDDARSLDTPIDSISTRPADNLVVGITTKQAISKAWNFEGEFDYSMLTNDITVPEQVIAGYSFINNLFLLETNSTTVGRKAIAMSTNYKLKQSKIQLKYRRVDPGYRTLGTSYINNDYEDISLKTSVALFDKKLNLALSGGLQRNNLEKERVTKLTRVIAGLDANYVISDKWNAAVNFSNFNSTTRQVVVTTFDSLFFAQVTQSIGGTLNRTVANEQKNETFLFAVNTQNLVVNGKSTSQFYNANLGWNIKWMASKTHFGANIMAVHSITETMTNSNVGPSLIYGKQLFKDKLQLKVIASYLPSLVDYKLNGQIINLTVSGNYALTKAHKLNYSIAGINKQNTGKPQSTEITATITYNYTF